LNRDSARARRSIEPSSVPRLSVGSSRRSMLSPWPVLDCVISWPSPSRYANASSVRSPPDRKRNT
jgi:hypothetical protein